MNVTNNIILWVLLHSYLSYGVFIVDTIPLFAIPPVNLLFGLCEIQQSTSLNGTMLVFLSDKNQPCCVDLY